MGVRITSQEDKVALFDSVSGFAFGPTFDNENDAESFLEYVNTIIIDDPRIMHDEMLRRLHETWSSERERIYGDQRREDVAAGKRWTG